MPIEVANATDKLCDRCRHAIEEGQHVKVVHVGIVERDPDSSCLRLSIGVTAKPVTIVSHLHCQ